MTTPTINHMPIIKGIILCGGMAPSGQTFNAHAAITCPVCRAKIEAKVAAHRAEAARHKAGSQQNRFFNGDADRNQRILATT